MPFTADVEQNRVIVRHGGEVTLDEAMAASQEALRLAREHRISRVIVDLRPVTTDPDPDELRLLMAENAEVKPPRPHAAFVVRPDQFRQFRFIEDFAVSRGMPIRVFASEDEAADWLAD